MDLTDEQYLGVLKRIRKAIAAGEALVAEDCTDIGNKYTVCTWGLCSDKLEYYPTPDLHTHPDMLPSTYSKKWVPPDRKCPMRKKGIGPWGCFYDCRVFRGKKPNREEAIKLYDDAIEEVEK